MSIKPNYVIAYTKVTASSEDKVTHLETFVQNLQNLGFEMEEYEHSLSSEIRFILLQIDDSDLLTFAELYKIGLVMNSVLYKFRDHSHFLRQSFLTEPDMYDDLFLRAEETFKGEKPVGLTSSERIFLVWEIFKRNRYGRFGQMWGIENLLKEKAITAVYPLHDGKYEWTEEGQLNDRQLLYEFWARPKRFSNDLPMNVIEKYLGTEYAFYYRWLGLYTLMLIIPSFCSIIVIVYGVATLGSQENTKSHEICSSTELLCPRCVRCKFYYIKEDCTVSNVTYVLNNTATAVFAVIISLWSTIVTEMWKRQEVTNQMKWNVGQCNSDVYIREEFRKRARYKEISEDTYDTIIPCSYKCLRGTIIITLMIGMSLAIFATTMLCRTLRMVTSILAMDKSTAYEVNRMWRYMPQFANNVIVVLCQIIFQKIYYKMALQLTYFENPRTEIDFDESYLLKCYFLDFLNYFFALLYLGFIKGRPYSHPGHPVHTLAMDVIQETCLHDGCTPDMAVMHFTIWFTRSFIRIIEYNLIPYLKVKMKKKVFKASNDGEQWEQDYLLEEAPQFMVAHSVLDSVMEYGFVTFFISAFPLAPLCAFIKNIIYLRLDAHKTMVLYRRPHSRKVSKLMSFSKLLQITTYFGIITNAAMISFNSDILPLELYRGYKNRNLSGFSTFTMSRFETAKVYTYYDYTNNVREKFCYYNGMREELYPFSLTLDRWWLLAVRFAALLTIQHFVFLVQGILSYMIPDVPYSVKEEIAHQQKNRREQSMKDIEKIFISKRRQVITKSERFVLIK